MKLSEFIIFWYGYLILYWIFETLFVPNEQLENTKKEQQTKPYTSSCCSGNNAGRTSI